MSELIMNRRAVIAGVALTTIGVTSAQAKAPEIYLDKGGVFRAGWSHAAGGYDVVAYFDLAEGAEPVAGHDEFTIEYKGVPWRFSSRENLETFVADPDRYRPQYGGYCAWAMARDKLARGAPEVWYVHDGKLYLNVSSRYQREWLENIERDITRANTHWPGILDRN